MSRGINFRDDLDGIEFSHPNKCTNIIRSVDLLAAITTVIRQLGV